MELWNDAYDMLMSEEATSKVANKYLETLAELLTDDKFKEMQKERWVDPYFERKGIKTSILNDLRDRSRRPVYMAKFVKDGQERAAKASKITEGVGAVANAILQAKPVADIILQIPHAAPAALPWAGVCLGLTVRYKHMIV
jgi:hypothetical protein